MTGTDGVAEAITEAIVAGRVSLGIELGSTRVKACLIGDDPGTAIAAGGWDWENAYVDGMWTYALDDVDAAVGAAFAALVDDVRERYGVPLRRLRAVGVSAMMHGYLAFDAAGELLVPFRTWRNTTTGRAAGELTGLLGVNIPMRWSIAHLWQAVLDGEEHVSRIASITTLAGYVHRRLTGRDVLGVGDASGVFPIGAGTADWDAALLARFDEHAAGRLPALRDLLPDVLPAGAAAGELTAEGAAYLDSAGELTAGAVCAPPEGDAGTGMVATNAVAPREGNVSAGTSVFAMVVLERPLGTVHEQVDLVTTPAGDPVAMVHCNNGASELGAWVAVFRRFAEAAGTPIDADHAFATLFQEALQGEGDAGGALAYNLLAGEPVVGVEHGRPLVVRTPDSRFTLGNLMRAEIYGVFASLALGMQVLADEGVRIDRMLGHGGIFRTPGVAERFLAAALDAPVAVGETAAEGGAFGMAVLAAYTAADTDQDLAGWLGEYVFAAARFREVQPGAQDVADLRDYLRRYEAGLDIVRAAAAAT